MYDSTNSITLHIPVPDFRQMAYVSCAEMVAVAVIVVLAVVAAVAAGAVAGGIGGRVRLRGMFVRKVKLRRRTSGQAARLPCGWGRRRGSGRRCGAVVVGGAGWVVVDVGADAGGLVPRVQDSNAGRRALSAAAGSQKALPAPGGFGEKRGRLGIVKSHCRR